MKHERIVADLKAEIRLGILRPGDKIPTIKELKARYGVGYQTVRAAELQLKSQILIERGSNRLVVSIHAPYMI